jgi:hypothetical protein
MVCPARAVVVPTQGSNDDLNRAPGNAEETLHIIVRGSDTIQKLLGKCQSLSAECGVEGNGNVTHNPDLLSWEIKRGRRSELLRTSLLSFCTYGKKLSLVHIFRSVFHCLCTVYVWVRTKLSLL